MVGDRVSRIAYFRFPPLSILLAEVAEERSAERGAARGKSEELKLRVPELLWKFVSL